MFAAPFEAEELAGVSVGRSEVTGPVASSRWPQRAQATAPGASWLPQLGQFMDVTIEHPPL
jgi:hypothetical protein